ncbi:MAG TPA: hypothetical protein VM492_02590 [Sumerlaeia bacterium]|nr:hypothetical protein [Sumerlaeia bacterium]
MTTKEETKEEKLVRLEKGLQDLRTSLPEHCYGDDGFISIHRTSAEHWQKIEDLEGEIRNLRAELGR